MYKLDLEKAEEQSNQIDNIHWIMEREREFQTKKSASASLTTLKTLIVCTKRQTGCMDENMCMYALSLITSLYLTPQIVCNYFILLGQSCFHYGLQL